LAKKIYSRKKRKIRRKRKSICSKQELLIGSELKKRNIDFISSHKVDKKIFDFYFPSLNLLVEYNGSYYHCDPRLYDENYYNKCKRKTASEIWLYDLEKKQLAESKGYYVEVIWESDYKKDNSLFYKLIKKYKKIIDNKV